MLFSGEMRWVNCPDAPGLMARSIEIDCTKKVEYLVVALDDAQHKARLSLRQADILDALAKDEELSKKGGCVPALQNIDK